MEQARPNIDDDDVDYEGDHDDEDYEGNHHDEGYHCDEGKS